MSQTISFRSGEQAIASTFPLWRDAHEPLDLTYVVPRDARVRFLLPFWGHGPSDFRILIRLAEPGAAAEVVGCYLGEGEAHLSLQLTVAHEAPDTRCRTLFKNAMADQSRFDFRGLIRILPRAARSDDHLEERALLLSRDAKSLAIPALEIETDDVKASHAAASGRLDENELFYLESRGIARDQALTMLIAGFFAPIRAAFPAGTLREDFDTRVAQLTERSHA